MRRASARLLQTIILAALVGSVTGLFVVAFQFLVLDGLWAHVLRAPRWVQITAPGIGIAIAVAIRAPLRSDSDTAEQYVRAYHDKQVRMRLRDLVAKFVAGVTTIGLGGSMGLEGPSLLIGGTVGDSVQRRLSRLFEREATRVLLVAGAAAGISAVFKAPLTGLVFAMEVPYRDDVARHVLGPALVASAAGYLVEVAARGVRPIVPIIGGSVRFSFRELALALLLGLIAGVVARGIVSLHAAIGKTVRSFPVGIRVAICGGVLAGIAALSIDVFGAPLPLGPGEEAIHSAAVGGLGVGALLLLLILKSVATSTTTAGGGVGGLFFPLVVMGTTLGAIFARAAAHSGSIFPLIGMASLLGAAYHTPLAGVSFVAEATGRAGFIVPAFVATAAAFATVGRSSISLHQRFRRMGPVERMLDVPVSNVMVQGPPSLPADSVLDSLVELSVRYRTKTFVVTDDDGRYVGTATIDRIGDVPRDEWSTKSVVEITRSDHPVAGKSWTVRRALEAMADADVDHLPVLDEDGNLLGVVLTSEVFRLTEVLDRLRAEGTGG